MGWGGGGNKGNGEMGKDLCPNLRQTFLENIDRSSCYDGCLFQYPGVPCRGDLEGHVKWEREKTSSDQ